MINITTVQNGEGDGDLGLDCKSFLELGVGWDSII